MGLLTRAGLIGVGAVLAIAGCQCEPPSVIIQGAGDGGHDGGGDAGRDASVVDAGGRPDAAIDCVPPDVLIALDRTLTMHRTAAGVTPDDTPAGHATSKWSMAISGIKQLTAPPLDGTIRFGLELWPKQSPGCITLAQRIQGVNATNASCEGPEVVIEPALSTGAAISSLLDPETTKICTSTPTGDALLGAKADLLNRRDGGRDQFVALVTDGADWDFSCPTPNPLSVVDGLADAGISTLIVGFSAEASVQNGVGAAFLNDMACAGGTAKGFPQVCAQDSNGHYRAKNPDAGGPDALFYTATNSAELVTALQTFAKTICCGCIN